MVYGSGQLPLAKLVKGRQSCFHGEKLEARSQRIQEQLEQRRQERY
jgi:hypothetical protein